MTTVEQIEKLPKWAQRRIEKLEADIRYLQMQLKQVGTDADTNIWITNGLIRVNLSNDSRIRYRLGNGQTIDVYPDSGFLGINGAHHLSISPVASNVIVLDVADPFAS